MVECVVECVVELCGGMCGGMCGGVCGGVCAVGVVVGVGVEALNCDRRHESSRQHNVVFSNASRPTQRYKSKTLLRPPSHN